MIGKTIDEAVAGDKRDVPPSTPHSGPGAGLPYGQTGHGQTPRPVRNEEKGTRTSKIERKMSTSKRKI